LNFVGWGLYIASDGDMPKRALIIAYFISRVIHRLYGPFVAMIASVPFVDSHFILSKKLIHIASISTVKFEKSIPVVLIEFPILPVVLICIW
jgi:hypothetical protein